MKITRRTDYAIHLIAELSENPTKPLGLRTLADRHNVTYAFARTVQQGLLKSGIIETVRGINGGIKLAKPLDEISLLEVFEAAQDPLDTAFNNDDVPWCECADDCVSKDVWHSTKTLLGEHLAGISMHHILKPKK
ncbi:MAG: Rrf2 family transcriptional regulator [Coriobacteriales bacterium]|jgi:Rrf2 family protein|nr:Rrf2 family transcriptional regulator [Coriobacteriales bacterium]